MNKKVIGSGAVALVVIVGLVGFGSISMKTRPNGPVSQNPPVDTSKTYSLADVQAHKDASSCWTAINGGVYDLTTWIAGHPGGEEAILSICGIDGSAAFNEQHGGQGRPESVLDGFKIGTLTK